MKWKENDDIESQHVDKTCKCNASSVTEDSYFPLLKNIEEMLDKTSSSPLTPDCCIYKVPEKVRKLNEALYTPRVVSIGPFHLGEARLQTMEKHKLLYLKDFLQRAMRSVKDFLVYIKESEERARHCYAETIELSSDEFVKMILLDGAFIIEQFLRISVEGVADENDYVLDKPWLESDVINDLKLLENQLPFFVLEGLYNLAFSSKYHFTFLKLSVAYFAFHNNQEISPQVEVKHFTDLLRIFHLPSSPKFKLQTSGKRRTAEISKSVSATELHKAGVKFKVGSSKCLFDIQFTDGMLKIPCFTFDDNTEVMIKNLMALEQWHYPKNTYICDYFFLMDSLIDTSKDVDLLVRNGIIINWLGASDEVATLINNQGAHIIVNRANSFYFSQLLDDLNAYNKRPWHSWKATLKRDYFNSPWRIVSTIAAFILLMLTLIQAVCSIISLLQN